VSLKFTDKNFKQRNCFWLSMHAYRTLLPSETDDSRFNSRAEKHIAHRLSSANSHIINRLLTSLVRSVLWNIRPLFSSLGSIYTKKPRSDISQYRPHARSKTLYYFGCISLNIAFKLKCYISKSKLVLSECNDLSLR
jgi:hypothetical protein